MFKCYVCIALVLFTSSIVAQDIVALYESAKESNPNLKKIQLEVDFQKARLKEMKSAFLPQLSIEGVYFYGDKTLTSQSGWDRVDNQNSLTMRTTLYNGGAEYTYFKYKDILPALAKNQQDSQLFEVFLQLNALYFDVLNTANQEKLIQKQIKGLKKRSNLLKKWSEIGRVRKSDYLSTLTQLKSYEAQLQQVQENLTTNTLNLKAMSGVTVHPENISFQFERFMKLPRSWSEDISNRPQFKLLEESIRNQRETLSIEGANLMPKVDLISNYYINRRQFGRKDNWDVAISLRWNFFDFGATSSRVEQQEVRLRQIEHDFRMSKINLKNEVKVVENQFLNQHKRLGTLKESYEVSKLNYEEQNKEFKKGLIDALDLNRALEQLIQAEITYKSMKYTIAEQWYALKLISGDISL